jgi:asparagine synthase (glutamine-hydrolysing)
MCGIAGAWWQNGTDDATARTVASRMADTLAHRGPDGAGVWADPPAGIALGHRRLAILDLSDAGDQPMLSASGRYAISYNGEAYNHLALRRELETAGTAPKWRGHSDTETLLACIECWGFETTLARVRGMFAFALWDRHDRALILARDRMGEKPLCYGRLGNCIVFASELRALRAHPDFDRPVDRDAVALLLRHCFIPAPATVYRGIRKLPPGCWLRIAADEPDLPAPVPYWSLGAVAEAGQREPFAGSEEEAAEALAALLADAVEAQTLSDVPLGLFLSGGIDSSTIAALAQLRADRPVRSFTIGFREPGFDEAPHAAAVARHLGTRHETLYASAADALALAPELGRLFDEPFADSSQIPTLLLSRLTRAHVTVALTGDGGDELFGGYKRHLLAPALWRRAARIPRPARKALGAMAVRFPIGLADLGARSANALLGRPLLPNRAGDRLAKLGAKLRAADDVDDLYRLLLTEWENAEQIVPGSDATPTVLDRRSDWPQLGDPESRMMALDGMFYLPDDILVKVDRSAMAASLETRAPFLDPRVVEFAWRLPLAMKIRDGEGKRVLRRVLHRHVPAALVERPKAGFGIPLDDWLRGGLRDWAEGLLSESCLRETGLLAPAPVRAAWASHLSGRRQFGSRLWPVLMLQAWCQANGATAS